MAKNKSYPSVAVEVNSVLQLEVTTFTNVVEMCVGNPKLQALWVTQIGSQYVFMR